MWTPPYFVLQNCHELSWTHKAALETKRILVLFWSIIRRSDIFCNCMDALHPVYYCRIYFKISNKFLSNVRTTWFSKLLFLFEFSWPNRYVLFILINFQIAMETRHIISYQEIFYGLASHSILFLRNSEICNIISKALVKLNL